MNSIALVGALARDPIQNETKNGKNRTYATIAVKNSIGVTDFISVTLYGKNATNLAKYKKKGDWIAFKGHVHSYKQENNDVTTFHQDIIIDEIEFLSSSRQDSDSSYQDDQNISDDDYEYVKRSRPSYEIENVATLPQNPYEND